MKTKALLLILFILPLFIFGQKEYTQFRSAKNLYYWKNKKPHDAYWQQDVFYNLKASVNDCTDVVTGNEELTYWNNSPDELNYVYFHLYANANTKDSYLADLYKNNNYHLKFGKYRKDNLGTEVTKMQVDGKDLKTELDNTILKVWLDKPLKAGDSITFNIDFKTYFDKEAIRNRMKLFNAGPYKHYDMVHWYPRISVYDKKFGWDTDQHMDHEFYGDYGAFHVEITVPNHYILDGTGAMINEPQVLPIELREKLDISNFKKKPWNSPAGEMVKRDGTTKTWKFSAVNVHDVAYTFDPTYRIGEAHYGNIRCIALVQEPHAAGWINAAKYVAKIIETNSRNIGMYAYPKMISADAQDGMEYPMIALNGGYDPEFRGLFIHELSHNWFFGMIGSNETYRACMDEGFTQFYTADTWENIEGVYDIEYGSGSNYVERYHKKNKVRETDVYYGYYNSVNKGEEVTLNTHSDGFNGGIRHGGGYGQVYTKTATMLYNLKYVLGDSLFVVAMQNYFDEWMMCHPYPEDFRNSIAKTTKADMNWFFDQWMETTKTIDYAVTKVKKVRKTKDQYKITFKRIGKMQMPIDFTVISKDSSSKSFYIPNTWFEKKTTATTLPRWIGWDKVKPTYTATVTIPGGIENVVIDTTHRLADVYGVNNSSKKNVTVSLDSKIFNLPDRNNYELFYRPAVWYNGFDGIKFGAHANGNYMGIKNVFDATVWFNSRIGQSYLTTEHINSNDNVSVLVNYKTSTEKFMKRSSFSASIRELDGLSSAWVGFEKKSNNDKNKLFIQLKTMLRDVDNDLTYLIYKSHWIPGKLNNTMNVSFDHDYNYRKGAGKWNLTLRTPFVYSDYDYSALTGSWITKSKLGIVNINTRLFAQVGTGNNVPLESMLYAAGANPEELMDNKYTRSMGIMPPFDFGAKTTNFAAGGGLNLRGYMGYLLYSGDIDGIPHYNYKGMTGTSASVEIEFDKLVKLDKALLRNTFKLTPYLFGDAGVINTNYTTENMAFSNIMADAGLGLELIIKRFWKLQTVKPLSIRADFPVFINRLPYAEKDYLQFRWMIGVNRAF
ncbi:MAG: M1 family metallopeptidase [Bacteroidota bacterium]|nr:M1 family metallopeptidase [Bacteroidota bacterium]